MQPSIKNEPLSPPESLRPPEAAILSTYAVCCCCFTGRGVFFFHGCGHPQFRVFSPLPCAGKLIMMSPVHGLLLGASNGPEGRAHSKEDPHPGDELSQLVVPFPKQNKERFHLIIYPAYFPTFTVYRGSQIPAQGQEVGANWKNLQGRL